MGHVSTHDYNPLSPLLESEQGVQAWAFGLGKEVTTYELDLQRSGSCKALFPSFIAEEVARKFRLGRLLILSLVLHCLPTLVARLALISVHNGKTHSSQLPLDTMDGAFGLTTAAAPETFPLSSSLAVSWFCFPCLCLMLSQLFPHLLLRHLKFTVKITGSRRSRCSTSPCGPASRLEVVKTGSMSRNTSLLHSANFIVCVWPYQDGCEQSHWASSITEPTSLGLPTRS